jgi:NAD-dependent DNA ligase
MPSQSLAYVKITSMIAEQARQERAETTADIAPALTIVDDEFDAVLEKLAQLRADVDELINRTSPSSRA